MLASATSTLISSHRSLVFRSPTAQKANGEFIVRAFGFTPRASPRLWGLRPWGLRLYISTLQLARSIFTIKQMFVLNQMHTFYFFGTIISQYTLSYGDFPLILRKWKEFVQWSNQHVGHFQQTWHSKDTAHFKDSAINYAMFFIPKDM